VIKLSKTFFLLLLAFALAVPFAGMPVAAHAQTASTQASTPETAAKKEQPKSESDEYRHSPMVTKFGSMLGMQPEFAANAFTLSNLLILLIALGYFIMKSLPGTFKSRSTNIKQQLTEARTATQEATARLSSVEQRLSKLDEQIASMKASAEAESAKAGERVKAAAEEEKKRILAAASQEIQSATATARREIMAYAAELAVEQATRKLVVTAEMDRLLIENFAQGLASKPGSQN
jgi:F-type H+-transporting ATPase subunit b